MILRHCTIAALALLMASCIADPVIACTTTVDVVARISDEMPDTGIAIVEGIAAERITAGISSVTRSDVPAGGSFVVAEGADMALTYVVRIASGCATHHGRFPRQLVRIWIAGQAAEN